jgi:type IV secretion system protein VirB9
MKAAVTALVLLTALFAAQTSPAQTLQNDSRLETVAYQDGATVPVNSAIGHGVMIVFAAGERVIAFDAADPEAFGIDESVNTGSMVIRTNRTPENPIITVRTQLRSYSFLVHAGMPEDADMVVQFTYGADLAEANSKPAKDVIRPHYRITGESALRPTQISDDGTRTFLVWGEDQALPAVFSVNPFGDEEIVDGYMRAGIYTIDRVYPRLVFRIDRKAAKAERIIKEGAKR